MCLSCERGELNFLGEKSGLKRAYLTKPFDKKQVSEEKEKDLEEGYADVC